MATNIAAAAALCRAAANNMKERHAGAIVNVTSVQERMPVPTYAAYAASKGALLALTRALAVELSPHGIRVNAVAPGVIATEAFERTLGGSRRDGDSTVIAALLGRKGHPEEVAAAVAFLASEEASFITGAELGGRRWPQHQPPRRSV